MSTKYILSTAPTTEMSVIEHSNELDITIVDYEKESWFDIVDLTPIELLTIALKMIQIASYYENDIYAKAKGALSDCYINKLDIRKLL